MLPSILQQQLDDKSEMVRSAVAVNLALLAKRLHHSQKYTSFLEMMVRLVADTEQSVAQAARSHLLPALLEWDSRGDAMWYVMHGFLQQQQ